MTGSTAIFAAVFAGLYVAHQVGDHWVQVDCQASRKAEKSWTGRLACASHVATYTLAAVVTLVTMNAALDDFNLSLWHTVAGLIVSAVTHYIADRRSPLAWLAKVTGHKTFITVNSGGISGPYLQDQSWHIGWLGVAALIIANGS